MFQATPTVDGGQAGGERPTGPLQGLRVLELGTLIAAPSAARLLGELGAEVIKVEDPRHGDPLRQWGEGGLWWKVQARNKLLVTLDLRRPEGQGMARELAARCDILLENFRPGRLDGWGMGDAVLRALHPGLVIVHLSGFGQTGPYRDRPGFGNVAESMAGLRFITGEADGPPLRTGISLGDEVAALYAALGAVCAVLHRTWGGPAQSVDVALTEAVFSLLESTLPEYADAGVVRGRSGNRLGYAAPSGVYPSRDGRWLAIGANADGLFRRLCDAMGRPDLAADTALADNRGRCAQAERLDEAIGAWVGGLRLDDALRRLTAAGIPAGPVYTVADIARDPQFLARGMIRAVPDRDAGTVHQPGIVPRFSHTPGDIRWAGGGLGADNERVYRDLLGLDAAAVRDLAARGVV